MKRKAEAAARIPYYGVISKGEPHVTPLILPRPHSPLAALVMFLFGRPLT